LFWIDTPQLVFKQPSGKHGFREKTATCVQRFDDSQILQFTLLIALCYVLHRYTSQEIHRWKLYYTFFDDNICVDHTKTKEEVFLSWGYKISSLFLVCGHFLKENGGLFIRVFFVFTHFRKKKKKSELLYFFILRSSIKKGKYVV